MDQLFWEGRPLPAHEYSEDSSPRSSWWWPASIASLYREASDEEAYLKYEFRLQFPFRPVTHPGRVMQSAEFLRQQTLLHAKLACSYAVFLLRTRLQEGITASAAASAAALATAATQVTVHSLLADNFLAAWLACPTIDVTLWGTGSDPRNRRPSPPGAWGTAADWSGWGGWGGWNGWDGWGWGARRHRRMPRPRGYRQMGVIFLPPRVLGRRHRQREAERDPLVDSQRTQPPSFSGLYQSELRGNWPEEYSSMDLAAFEKKYFGHSVAATLVLHQLLGSRGIDGMDSPLMPDDIRRHRIIRLNVHRFKLLEHGLGSYVQRIMSNRPSPSPSDSEFDLRNLTNLWGRRLYPIVLIPVHTRCVVACTRVAFSDTSNRLQMGLTLLTPMISFTVSPEPAAAPDDLEAFLHHGISSKLDLSPHLARFLGVGLDVALLYTVRLWTRAEVSDALARLLGRQPPDAPDAPGLSPFQVIALEHRLRRQRGEVDDNLPTITTLADFLGHPMPGVALTHHRGLFLEQGICNLTDVEKLADREDLANMLKTLFGAGTGAGNEGRLTEFELMVLEKGICRLRASGTWSLTFAPPSACRTLSERHLGEGRGWIWASNLVTCRSRGLRPECNVVGSSPNGFCHPLSQALADMSKNMKGHRGSARAPPPAMHIHQPHLGQVVSTSANGRTATAHAHVVATQPRAAIPSYIQEDIQTSAAVEDWDFSYDLGDTTLLGEVQGPETDGIVLTTKKKKVYENSQWNGKFFVRRSLKELGLVIQLGHPAGTSCPNSSKAPKDFVLIDVTGVHLIALNYCLCDSNIKERQQLMRDRRRAFRHIVRQYRITLMMKRAGRGHDRSGVYGTAQGELALQCRACPQAGMNLPDRWDNITRRTISCHVAKALLQSFDLSCSAMVKASIVNINRAG
ncbi:hypothetical protein C8F01DRAFT_1087830 [Mycena amicta]|nr:hypothetical protein C8F01DRAFT_1087830 [Mycena amicta]